MPTVRQCAARMAALVIFLPAASLAQDAPSPVTGSYVGVDSLDATKEPATQSRRRGPSSGTATWTIELDTLDLRRKFTLRLDVAAPSPMSIVLRMADSMPPKPGRYGSMIPSTGASHGKRSEIHADIYAVEGGRPRYYHPLVDTLVITRVTTMGGKPIVEGSWTSLANRYADAPRGTMVPDNVWLRASGRFVARGATQPRPAVTVTARMQEQVLRRALDGFLITSMGALNGDGDADSTRDAVRARAFLESRWRESAIIERLTVDGRRYSITLRGRFVPVLCEGTSNEEPADCTTLPATVVLAGRARPSRIEGRFARESLPSAAAKVTTVHLLPNPVPMKEAFEKLCAVEDSILRAAEREIIPRLEAMKDSAKADSAATEFMWSNRAAYEKRYRALFESFAVRHVPIATNGSFAFADVPAGNYLLFAWLPDDSQRIEWYLPITVQGSPLRHDLERSNVSNGDWYCGTRMPFPVVRAARR